MCFPSFLINTFFYKKVGYSSKYVSVSCSIYIPNVLVAMMSFQSKLFNPDPDWLVCNRQSRIQLFLHLHHLWIWNSIDAWLKEFSFFITSKIAQMSNSNGCSNESCWKFVAKSNYGSIGKKQVLSILKLCSTSAALMSSIHLSCCGFVPHDDISVGGIGNWRPLDKQSNFCINAQLTYSLLHSFPH